jgi:hypothetical protein
MPNNMKKAGMSYGKGGSKRMSYKKGGSKRYKKGGSKPDYLDFDKDGNTTEPMKSTYYGGGSVYNAKGVRIPGMQRGGSMVPRINPDLIPEKPNRDRRPMSPSAGDRPPTVPRPGDYRDKMIMNPDAISDEEMFRKDNYPGLKPNPDLKNITGQPGSGQSGFSDQDWLKLHSEKRKQGIGYTGGATNPNNPNEYGTLFEDGTFQKEGVYKKKRGGVKYQQGGAVFNRNGTRVPGMRKGR